MRVEDEGEAAGGAGGVSTSPQVRLCVSSVTVESQASAFGIPSATNCLLASYRHWLKTWA